MPGEIQLGIGYDIQPPEQATPYDLMQELGIMGEDWDQLGPQAKRIISELIPQFVQRFVGKSLHYGDANANVLGPAGQFADIWRKIGPLRRSLWEGKTLNQEQPDEICMDLIGHLLLTIDMLQQKVDRRGSG
jgi:hypothetical protein